MLFIQVFSRERAGQGKWINECLPGTIWQQGDLVERSEPLDDERTGRVAESKAFTRSSWPRGGQTIRRSREENGALAWHA